MTEPPGGGARRVTPAPEALAAHLDGEAGVLHVGTERDFQLKGTGAIIWGGVGEGRDRGGIVDRLCAEFEVSRDAAAAEVTRLFGELEANALVRPVAAEADPA